MKKALIASLLGIALNITTSHGQGYIVMESYQVVTGGIPVFSGVTYYPGGPYVGAASGFKADLLFSLNGGTTYTLVAGSQIPFYGTFNGQPSDSHDGGSPTTDGAGVFIGSTVTIPGYTSGSVSFIVEVFNGATYGQAGKYNGQSAVFSIASLQTNNALPAGTILANNGTSITGFQSFYLIPEPTTFSLASLGAAALMIFRRRK